MRIAIRTKPLNHMNPRTRGFKVNGINHPSWGAEIQEPTSLMTIRFPHHTTQHLESDTSTSAPMTKEPFISTRNHPEANYHLRLHNSLASPSGDRQHTMQAHCGISVRKKKHTCAKPWARLLSHSASCLWGAYQDWVLSASPNGRSTFYSRCR